jgi:deoxyribonuclease-4
LFFGAHCSTSGGFHTALIRGKAIGAEAVQIFVKNNMRWRGKAPDAAALSLYAKERQATSFHCVFGHTGYLINLAARSSDNRTKSLESLVQEIEFAGALGLPFIVMHPGAHLGTGEAEGVKQIVAGLNEVFAITRRSRVRIALENTAGQGSCLGNRFEHLAAIFDGVRNTRRVAVCLDTAHLFAAGYDIRTPKGWNHTMHQLDSLVGLDQVVAFHLNDSKTDLGSQVDRHAHIGQGKIGVEGFRAPVNDSRFERHPACLETPKSDDLHEDILNLKTLRSLIEPRRARVGRDRKLSS